MNTSEKLKKKRKKKGIDGFFQLMIMKKIKDKIQSLMKKFPCCFLERYCKFTYHNSSFRVGKRSRGFLERKKLIYLAEP